MDISSILRSIEVKKQIGETKVYLKSKEQFKPDFIENLQKLGYSVVVRDEFENSGAPNNILQMYLDGTLARYTMKISW